MPSDPAPSPQAEMLIRPAAAVDVPAMLALERASATAAHWSRERYAQAVTDVGRLALVLEARRAVRGFLIARDLNREWEIENLVVYGPVQRQGLGTRLLREFIQLTRHRGAQNLFLEVRESNVVARALYGKCGFEENGRRARYYRQPDEDAVLYRLVLL